MKKLRLELDALEVESFEVARTEPPTGTVHGHNTATQCNTSPDRTCAEQMTCGPNTCIQWCTLAFDTCDTICNYTQTCETECEQTCFSCDSCAITCAEGCTA
jgi:hypothetical protein